LLVRISKVVNDVGYVLVSVRLVGYNSLPSRGRLMVNYNGTWGTVCGHGFDNRAAQVACYMLGFG